MRAEEAIRCRGHPHIQATHPTTFEITTDPGLTLQGDCIIGIGSGKGAADLDPGFRRILCSDGAVLWTLLEVGDRKTEVHSRGSSRFTLSHPTDMVWRRSSYVDGRTVGIRSDRVAATLPREMIRDLQRGEGLLVTMRVFTPGRVP